MKRKLIQLATLTWSMLTGACATGFGPMGSEGGYQEKMVRENAYVISFTGNGFTSKERTRDFALYRAAQIGDKLHFTHFVVMGEDDLSRSQTIYTGSTTTTNASVYGNSGTATSTTVPTMIPMYFPGTSIGALYFDGPPEGRYLQVFDIEAVLKDIGSKYKLK